MFSGELYPATGIKHTIPQLLSFSIDMCEESKSRIHSSNELNVSVWAIHNALKSGKTCFKLTGIWFQHIPLYSRHHALKTNTVYFFKPLVDINISHR
jgi:hypothetical protein